MRLSPFIPALALALSGVPSFEARAEGPDLAKESAELDRLGKQLVELEGRIKLVESQYVERPDPSEAESLKRRYSDAEIQFLLNNYQAASVLLYDLLGSVAFRGMPEYSETLYMLAESLYQQDNFLGARLYFREHMNRRGRYYRDALARYLEISGRINEFSGIDQYIEQAKQRDGSLPVDVNYVYGKWLFRRTDIPDRLRIERSRQVFSSIAQARGAFALEAQYFLGVLSVQQGALEQAVADFRRVLDLPASDERGRKVREMANLSLGRVYFELGRYSEAIDRYQEIDYRSDNFVDALFEIAWSHVRRAKEEGPGEYEKALQACEKLLTAAPDSLLAPEALILQGHLLLKLGKYEDATVAYNQIINRYLEVYDDIDGRLKAHPDPVQYFQRAISESGKTFDISAFLPEKAIPWATTQREVADAVRVTNDIDASERGVVEANEIAVRLLDVLENRQLEVFPDLQEGLARAEAVEASLAGIETELLRMEERLIGAEKLASIRSELDRVRAERQALAARLASLPTTEQAIAERKAKMNARVAELEQEAYRLGLQVQSLYASLAALEKFVADTRDQRIPDPQAEREFADRMRKEREVADQLGDQLEAVQRRIRDEKARLGLLGSADANLRAEYERMLAREKELMGTTRGGLGAQASTLLSGIDSARGRIVGLRGRSTSAKEQIRRAVARRAEGIRKKVQDEAKLLVDYEREVKAASSSARNLIGTIAYESFKRVRRQFYELVLKADVGLVDVAWTRKQNKTNEIQDLAKQKEREVKGLEDEFKEVLREVD